MNRQPPRWQFQTISLNSRNLSGLRHKYDDVRCAQFGLWRGARRAHPRPGAVTDEQRSHRPNSAQPEGRQVFFAQTLLLAPHRSTAGYARRSRLVWAKNPLPRTSSYLCLRPLQRFFGPLLVVTLFLAFASWTAHSQGILVPRGAVWKYFDQGIDLGTAWRGTGFGDGSWASGPARLGFGGDGEVTMVSYGPDLNNKYVTTYFRKSFNVTNAAALTTLTLNLLRNHGAVVSLNADDVRR